MCIYACGVQNQNVKKEKKNELTYKGYYIYFFSLEVVSTDNVLKIRPRVKQVKLTNYGLIMCQKKVMV